MPQKGLHPLRHLVRVVQRNGASFTLETTMRRSAPYVLQSDTTNNHVYTGEKGGLSMEDERMQKLMSKYEGFVADALSADEAAGPAAPAAAPAGGPSTVKAAGGKKKKK